jgi:inosose dehydratase
VGGEQSSGRALLVAALGLLQRVGEGLDGQRLQDDAAVALQGGQGQALAAEDGVHDALAVEPADALDAVLDALLEGAGYGGWYVLEQDTILDREPDEGAGPIGDVRACLDFLAGIAA